jgi:hypothetical protein
MALVSTLDAIDYSGDVISEKVEQAEWLAPRAMTHDSLVTWASDRGAVVPFPMWVMFGNDAAVLSMLSRKSSDLRESIDSISGAREFCVRVSADQSALAAAAEQMDPALAVISQQALAAPPGQAYLLRRKLAEARKTATRDAAGRIAERAHAALSDAAWSGVARATTVSSEPGILLDAAYLVADEKYEQFRTALTRLMETFQPAGLRFDFTGPWPPYHFVHGD